MVLIKKTHALKTPLPPPPPPPPKKTKKKQKRAGDTYT
jgi:hypothetical protein